MNQTAAVSRWPQGEAKVEVTLSSVESALSLGKAIVEAWVQVWLAGDASRRSAISTGTNVVSRDRSRQSSLLDSIHSADECLVKLPTVELKELRLLDALLAERSVTRAAERVGLSQPAASNALARLRKAAGDPLFVRAGRGIEPTTRALSMAPMLAQVLGQIDRAFVGQRRFDPATSTQTFTLAATDFGQMVLLPPLLRVLESEAPGVRIHVVPLGTAFPMQELESGRLDLLVGSFKTAPPRLYRQSLFSEGSVSLLRRGHPASKKKLTLEQFAALGHVLVSPRGETGGIIDDVLAQHGLARKVVATVPHFLVAVFLVEDTDLVVSLPQRVARHFSRMMPLSIAATPVAMPRVTISQLCHERALKDPAQRWLRSTVLRVARAT